MMRYVLFVVGVCSSFVMPAPLHGYYEVDGSATVVHDIVAIAALVVLSLVLGGSLVSLMFPRATFWSFVGGGSLAVLVGIGTLQPFMIICGAWALLLAGLCWLGIWLDGRQRGRIMNSMVAQTS